VSSISNPPFADTNSAKNHLYRLHALITRYASGKPILRMTGVDGVRAGAWFALP